MFQREQFPVGDVCAKANSAQTAHVARHRDNHDKLNILSGLIWFLYPTDHIF
jgi:hypothetical protein